MIGLYYLDNTKKIVNSSINTLNRCTYGWSKVNPIFDANYKYIDFLTSEPHKLSRWNNQPYATVHSFPFCDLLRFPSVEQTDRNILLVAPLSGHHATLLNDTLRTLRLSANVYITDWQNARDVPLDEGEFSLDTYANYVIQFIEKLNGNCHVIAVCQPVVAVLSAVALMSQHGSKQLPISMTLISGPIDGRQSPTSVNRFATSHDIGWFERNMIDVVPCNYTGRGRLVYPGFVQHSCFVAMNTDRHAQAYQNYYRALLSNDSESIQKHEDFYNEFNSVLDLPASFYLETIKYIFQDFALPNGRLKINGELVDPSSIKDVGLMTVEGGKDDISGKGQTHAAIDLCYNLDHSIVRSLTNDHVGHYGSFSGSVWESSIYLQIADFMQHVEHFLNK